MYDITGHKASNFGSKIPETGYCEELSEEAGIQSGFFVDWVERSC